MKSSTNANATPSPAKRFLGNLLVLVITVAVIIALGELTMRVLYPTPEFSSRLWRRQWNGDYRKSAFIPGTEVIYAGIPTKINSLGLRNREIDLCKGEGVSRILVFGDSFTFGDGLSTEQTLPCQVERLLNRKEGGTRRFEVINFGVSGMNTFQEVM
jgi:hypothetical protein